MNDEPVENALVCALKQDEVYEAGYTDSNGNVQLNINTLTGGELYLTVSAHNAIPYLTTLSVQSSCCVSMILDSSIYSCNSIVNISLWDSDLNNNPEAVESAIVLVSSQSEPEPESVTLTETGPNTGNFTGSIQLSNTQSGPGYLLVSHQDTITVSYNDECEGEPRVVSETATTDCEGPIISNVQIQNISTNSATITWQTDENSDSIVFYGPGIPPAYQASSSEMTTSHSITLEDLTPCTIYFVAVCSTDQFQNQTIDNNSNQYYTFTTHEMVYLMQETMDTKPPWTIYGGDWQYGEPLGQEGDPSSGYTGTNVYGFNLAGAYFNDCEEFTLTTNPIDCSNTYTVILTFYRWLGVQASPHDYARVKVSTDGVNFTTIWENPNSNVVDTEWQFQQFDISQYAAGQSTVYI